MKNLAKRRLRTVAAFTLWGVVIGARPGSDHRPVRRTAALFFGCPGSLRSAFSSVSASAWGRSSSSPAGAARWPSPGSASSESGATRLLMITVLTAVNAVDRSIVLESRGPSIAIAFLRCRKAEYGGI